MLSKMSLLLSILVFFGVTNNVWGQISDENSEPKVRVVEPDVKTDEARPAIFDTEKYEIGVYTGALSVEDFNTNLVTGLNFVYHFGNRWYAQFNYGSADVDRATFEDVVGFDFLAPGDRKFKYMNALAAYQILHGRSYFRESGKYNSGFYVLGGIGSVDFAANSGSSLVVGASYRIVRTDWLLLHLDYRNHIFDRDFIDDSKKTFNNELVVGFNVFF